MDVMHVLYGGLGGQMSVAGELARGFREHGLRTGVCLYAPPGAFVADEALVDFDLVRKVEKRHKADLAGARAIGRLVRQLRPRAVLWHSAYAPLALARARAVRATRSVVLVEHQALRLRGWVYEERSLIALPVATSVVFLSDGYREGYRLGRLPLPALKRAATVPNGVDLGVFRPRTASNAVLRPREVGELHLGMAGRMVPGKCFDEVLQAVARLRRSAAPPVRLLLAGDGPDRAALQELAASLGIADAVDFLGQLDEAALAAYLRDLDVYVHATRGETASTILLQAFATGLSVVASAVEGVRGVIEQDVDGLLVPGGDVAALVLTLRQLLDDPTRRARLGAAARARAEADFGSDVMVSRYLHALTRWDPEGPWARAARRGADAARQ